MDNNYYVSATNYGWGPDAIGDRTDIPNWPEWFTGARSATYLPRCTPRAGQNMRRLRRLAAPGERSPGENTIVLFKSCFPNSDLSGNPTTRRSRRPNGDLSVANAKAVYIDLLSYFATRPDKLFIVVTAPPLRAAERRRPAPPTPAPSTTGWSTSGWPTTSRPTWPSSTTTTC